MTGDKDARRKRNMKWLAYIVAGVIAQTAIIVVFVLLVMRIRNLKVRIDSVTVENVNVTSSSSSPSFNMKLTALVTVKNTNFGHFKFDDSTATISYRGAEVGEGTIPKARAKARSTRKLNITVPVSSSKLSSNSGSLVSDIGSGILPLSSHAKLNGKIHLFKIFKKKKSAEMNCTMEVDTKKNVIQKLTCK
ncbi:hypothetical protein F2P56_031437 [Juglans regia]|uniref:Late embryogenesis abundant protein LEA-2 subgroup domain-containing protein n=2 Tax=Juglans regia TaxID=51240 RepID=A0A833WIK0_JUGRE|nr:late embryogenesis abundant protein At1g64065-like [Juglans regia]KAF5451148.1 hypothetical protein F2P56_031437 [Juglans regia]